MNESLANVRLGINFATRIKNRDMPTTTKAKNEPAEARKNDTTQFSRETYLYWYESMQLMRKFEEEAGQLAEVVGVGV